jgi:hypothetical protein
LPFGLCVLKRTFLPRSSIPFLSSEFLSSEFLSSEHHAWNLALNTPSFEPPEDEIRIKTRLVMQSGLFDWERQWYPLAVADQLDPGRPNKAALLGRALVVWRDPEGTWRAFEDRCPHRLAPLTGANNCSHVNRYKVDYNLFI